MDVNFCDICNRVFANKYNLKNHKDKAKCNTTSENNTKNQIILQNDVKKCKKMLKDETQCKYCKKNFATIYTLERHYKSCLEMNNVEMLRKIIDEQKIKILEYENIIKNNHQNYKILETKLTTTESFYNELKQNYQELFEKYSHTKVQNTTNNNNNTYNNSNNSTSNQLNYRQIVSKLDPICHEDISNSMKNLTSDFIDDGLHGFARFMCIFPCNKKFITTDASRNVIAYRTKIEEFIRDPECLNLINITLKNNSETVLKKTEERRDYYRILMENNLELDGNSEYFEMYSNKRENINQLKNVTEAAVNENPNNNIKTISNILSNHGMQNLK
jgi:hypothetical protein